MIDPKEVSAAGKAKEQENARFLAFLKDNAESEELDRRFADFHNELFMGYDCCKCNNCCRSYSVGLSEPDIERLAEFLGLPSKRQFISSFDLHMEFGQEYVLNAPCQFLLPSGACSVEKIKPQVCRDYPYTDKPDRLSLFLTVIAMANVCPIVYEIVERLKTAYGFG